MRTLLIRADAGTIIGTGHVMRCLALAHAWQDSGGSIVFVMHSVLPALAERLTTDGCKVVVLDESVSATSDIDQTVGLARQFRAEWVVVDGYQFDAQYQIGIKESGLRLAWVDDFGHATNYVADIVLNQNLYAAGLSYSNRAKNTQLLLGARYVLLRREFRRFKNFRRVTATGGRKILVTLGGSDPHNVSFKVMKSLKEGMLEDYEAVVIAGYANPFIDELVIEAVRHKTSSIRVLVGVSDMPEQMAWADLAVSAAGATAFELAFMGVPSLLVETADNQKKNIAAFKAAGTAVCLGRHGDLTVPDIAGALAQMVGDPERMNTMWKRGQKLVDSDGADRVATVLRGDRVRLRSVSCEDQRLVWEWVNDSVVRAMSFSSHYINWDEHTAWFKAKLTDPECCFYVAVDALDREVGHIRFDLKNTEAVVSVTVSPGLQGKGYGREILRIATETLFASTGIHVVRGLIKKDNEASMRAFLGAGFCRVEDLSVNGCVSAQFELTRKDFR